MKSVLGPRTLSQFVSVGHSLLFGAIALYLQSSLCAGESKNTSEQDFAFREFRPSPAKNWDEQLLYQRGIEA